MTLLPLFAVCLVMLYLTVRCPHWLWRRPAPATLRSSAPFSDFRDFSTNFYSVDDNPSPHISNLPSTMSFLGSSSPKSNEDIKTALLQQVQQEQAMINARALIGVRHSS